ncbi:uncharacterized protein PG986_008015 [Apiospora aurea]|uniref:Methyltransferase domain-containing protein n=1 Tax=Apiospora aurea TaxID=335848 RepID=A0ABR1QE82_9PEZI
MAPPTTDNNNHLAEKLQEQFRSVPVTAENHDAKRALLHAMDRVMAVPGARLLAQAGLLPPVGDDGDAAPKDKQEGRVEPFALFDSACGTGLITGLLQKQASPAVLRESRFVCADLNANLVDIVKWRAAADGWEGTVETAVVDAQKPTASSAPTAPSPSPSGPTTTRAGSPTCTAPSLRCPSPKLQPPPPPPLMPDRVPMAVHGLNQWIDPAGIRAELASSSPHTFDNIRIETLEHTSHVDSAEYFVQTFDMMRKWMMQSYWLEGSRQAAAEMGEARMDENMINHLQQKHGGKSWDIRWKSILVTCRKQ